MPVFLVRVAGSVHSFSPVASPTKFSTVFGASLLKSFTTTLPSVVSKCAYRSLPAFTSSSIAIVVVLSSVARTLY